MAGADDEERISVAESRARDGETAAATELLWTLLSELAARPYQEEAALSVRRRALEVLSAIAPEDVEVACARARILLPDDVPGALGVIRAALRLAPRSIPVLRVLAEVHRTAGEDEKALGAYLELLAACRTEIAKGVAGLSPAEKMRVFEVKELVGGAYWERAEERLRTLLERDTLDSGVHRIAAEIARAFDRPPDRGLEHEILSVLLLVARNHPRAGAVFQRARKLYADVAILPILERSLQ